MSHIHSDQLRTPMAGFTPFTSNYSDLSDENGYQFEFRCDVCGSGYRSEFTRSALTSP